jgi:hypothetical protein
MKIIPTKVHGVLDYLTVGTLLALPRMLNWSDDLVQILTFAALGILLYSLLTRYELSLAKLIPMMGHLVLDTLSALLLLALPFVVGNEGTGATPILIGLAIFELVVTLLTRTEPDYESDSGRAITS